MTSSKTHSQPTLWQPSLASYSPIYHLSIVVHRKHCCLQCDGIRIVDGHTGELHYYTKHTGVSDRDTFLPTKSNNKCEWWVNISGYTLWKWSKLLAADLALVAVGQCGGGCPACLDPHRVTPFCTSVHSTQSPNGEPVLSDYNTPLHYTTSTAIQVQHGWGAGVPYC